MIEGSEGYWGKFPDVFDPELRRRRCAAAWKARSGKSAGDPWCIGYFSDNEMSWGDEVSLALAALKSPPDQPAKKVFVADLKAKYGDIGQAERRPGARRPCLLGRAAGKPRRPGPREGARATWRRSTPRPPSSISAPCATPSKPSRPTSSIWAAGLPGSTTAPPRLPPNTATWSATTSISAAWRISNSTAAPTCRCSSASSISARWTGGCFTRAWCPWPTRKRAPGPIRSTSRERCATRSSSAATGSSTRTSPSSAASYDEENYQIGFVDVADTPYAETVRACREVGDQLYH